MRVLMTTDTVGGVWTFTQELSTELLRRGHAVAMVSFGRAPSADQADWWADQRSVYGDRFQFTATDIPLEWMDGNSRAFTEGEPVLLTVADAFKPHLLLSNQFCFGALTASLPRVVVAHSDVLSWAKACKPDAATPSPWLNQYTSLVQSGLMSTGMLVAPTRWMLNAVKQSFFLPSGGFVIPNGRSISAVTDADQPRLLQAVSAGRLWDEAKGLNLLLEQALPLPVLIAGETRFEQQEAIPTSAADVRFLGSLASEQLQQLFRGSAIYLCTSRYEPFGLAPLEAALCGCAVLARDLPSLREIWGEDALYFTDATSLLAQTRLLVDRPDMLADAQCRAKQRAQRYTAAQMTDSYLQLFEAVLQRHVAMPHVA